MAFWKSILAEALHLVEASCREGRIIAARDHTLDHHVLIVANRPHFAESGHRPAQTIGFIG